MLHAACSYAQFGKRNRHSLFHILAKLLIFILDMCVSDQRAHEQSMHRSHMSDERFSNESGVPCDLVRGQDQIAK